MTPYSVNILGVRINSTSAGSVLKKILDFEANFGQNGLKPEKPLIIFTPNPEFLVAAAKDKNYRNLLNSSDINIPDGVGLLLAGRVLGQPIAERVSGADLVEKLLLMGNEEACLPAGRWKVGIAGARRGDTAESEELIKKLAVKYPRTNFYNLDHPISKKEYPLFNLVLACHGMKKQEKWIMDNKERIRAGVFMGVGGSLDFLAGFTKRAPVLMQRICLEWLWRGLQKPAHWRRIFTAVFRFNWLVLKAFLRLNSQKP